MGRHSLGDGDDVAAGVCRRVRAVGPDAITAERPDALDNEVRRRDVESRIANDAGPVLLAEPHPDLSTIVAPLENTADGGRSRAARADFFVAADGRERA